MGRFTLVTAIRRGGLRSEQILEELPDLELEDIQASLRFASQRLDPPVVAA